MRIAFSPHYRAYFAAEVMHALGLKVTTSSRPAKFGSPHGKAA